MNGEPLLLLRLLAAMAAMLAVAALLARGLRRPLRREVAIAAVALPLLLLLPWLADDLILLPNRHLARDVPGTGIPFVADPYSFALNDVSLLLAPWEIEVRRQLSEGRLPLWSDRIDGGSSPWADPQVSVLSPTSALARLLPARHHFLGALALKVELALCGAWVAARLLGSRRRGALLAASGFAIGGGILAWGLFPHSSVAAWAPWCVAAGLRVARRPGPGVWAATVAAVTGSMLAGQPEIAAAVGGLTALFALLYGRSERRLRALARVALAGALAFGLSAPVLVPFLSVVPHSQRAFDREVEGERQLARKDLAARTAWLSQKQKQILRAPLSPWSAGVPYASTKKLARISGLSGYTGLVALAGAAAALALRAARRRAWPLVLIAVAISALAAKLPLIDTIWSVPGLHLLEPSRIVPLAALCLCMAAAHGFDGWLRARRQRTARTVAVVAALVLGAGFAFAPAPGAAALLPVRGDAAVIAAVVLSALVAVRTPRLALAILGLALLSDQVPWGRRLLPPGDPRLFYPPTADVDTIVRLAGGPGGRVVGHGGLLYPAILSTYGLSDPRTHNPLASARYNRVLAAAFGFAPDMWHYFAQFNRPEHPLLDFLGVRAVVSHRLMPRIPGTRTRPLTNPFYFVAVRRSALPRAFVTPSYDLVEDDALTEWITAMSDPRRVALDPSEAADRLPRGGLRAGRARIVANRDGHLSVTVRGAGHRLLATSLRGPEGWRARGGDGRSLDTVTVNGAFLGVIVGPKVDRVELDFRPPGLGLGLLLSSASLILATGAGIASRLRRRPRSRARVARVAAAR